MPVRAPGQTAGMQRAIVLVHVPREGCARIGDHLRGRGIAVTEVLLYAGQAVPAAVGADDLLVVMGGPMGVGDLGDPQYPFLAREVALLRRCLAEDRRVLGICLGSQLLAHAAGARVYPNHKLGRPDERVREVGWFPVDLHGTAGDPMLRGLPPRVMQLHWHGDTFELPAGAVHLASTPECRHQMYRIGRRQVGIQFHPEVDRPTIAAWCAEDAAFACLAHGPGTPERILSGLDTHYASYVATGDRMLALTLDAMS